MDWRRVIATALALAAVSLLGTPAWSGVGARQSAAVRELTVAAEDGYRLAGRWYRAPASAPGVLLVPMCARERDQTDYAVLGSALAAVGLHALSYDLAGIGASRTDALDVAVEAHQPRLEERLPTDAAAVFAAFSELESVTDVIAVVGASCGAAYGMMQALEHDEVRAWVTLSGGIPSFLLERLGATDRLAVFGVASRDDGSAAERVQSIVAVSTHPLSELVIFDTAGHGTRMLYAEPDVVGRLVGWLVEATRARP